MAGGIDWFRWHHGTVTDPKFQLIAKKAGVKLPCVLAVWAFILEQSSASDDRGSVSALDCESLDLLFGFDDGQCSIIVSAMESRGLLVDGRIHSWEKRQPKREREDISAADRKRAQRMREAEKLSHFENVTPCHTMSRHVTPREEENRGDKDTTTEACASVDNGAGAPYADPASAVNIGKVTAQTGESDSSSLHCPVSRIVSAYHELMPDNPRVKVLNDARKRMIAARWREASRLECQPFGYSTVEGGLSAWRVFFEVCAQSEFLTGKTKSASGKPPFLADIDFLMSPAGFAKCLENKYHREAA